ncbi:MAG: cob(I)yrinic acid a,c-diamide adenosyltransferase [Intestinibacillus sp.]
MREQGLIHLYCGDGKGKTTAAMGLALRCVGRGRHVVIAQFLKDGTSGECFALAKLGNVTLLHANPYSKFSNSMTDGERRETAEAVACAFREACARAVQENARLLVLDEVCAAVACGFFEENEVITFLDQKPESLEVVLTGRNPSEMLQAKADYISEIIKRRHPFDQGIPAREDIEL